MKKIIKNFTFFIFLNIFEIKEKYNKSLNNKFHFSIVQILKIFEINY